MKRILVATLAILALALPARSAEIAYNQYLVNTLLTSTQSYTIDLSAYGADSISFGLGFSSGSYKAQTFNDGVQSTNTLTVVSTQPLVGVAAVSSYVVKSTTSLAATAGTNIFNVAASTTQLTALLSSPFTVTVNGRVLTNTVDFFIVPSSASLTAINIANAISGAGVGINATATVASSSITLTCAVAGTACNSYGVSSSSSTAFVAQNAKMTGGVDNSFFTIAGRQFTQGADFTADVLFASNTIASMASAINTLNFGVTASTQADFVTLKLACSVVGVSCNGFTVTSSTPAALSVSSATMLGGQMSAFVQIGPFTLTQGTTQGPSVWAIGTSSITTAVNISSCIRNTPGLNTLFISTDNGKGVITSTAISAGTDGNVAVYSSTRAALSWLNNQYLGGAGSAVSLTGSSFNVLNHGYATGLQVWWSTGSAVSVAPLTNGTTYYAIALDGNNLQLAATSTGAAAGTFIVLTSSSPSTTTHSFTTNPLPITGTMGMSWNVSNDGVNWSTPTVTVNNVVVSSVSVATPYAANTASWDFGAIAYRFMKFTFWGPQTGEENVAVYGYGKRYKW